MPSSRILQSHPLAKPSIEKKVEKVFVKLNEEKKSSKLHNVTKKSRAIDSNQDEKENNFMRNVNNILRKNRKILADIGVEGRVTISKDKLLELGFHFGYYTHTYTTRKGTIYYFCYEYGYIPVNDNSITIVHRNRTQEKAAVA